MDRIFVHFNLGIPLQGQKIDLKQIWLYLSICKEENHVLAFHSCHSVQFAQVFVEAVVIITATQLDLKAAVAAHVSSQTGQRLFSSAADANQQGVAAFLSNHASDSEYGNENGSNLDFGQIKHAIGSIQYELLADLDTCSMASWKNTSLVSLEKVVL